MSLAEQRALALGAVRSQLAVMQLDPVTVSAGDAHVVLDDLARQCPDLVASQWYQSVFDKVRASNLLTMAAPAPDAE